MRWSIVMNLPYIQGEEVLSRSTKSSLTWVINKALYVFALYPVFTGGGIFLDTLVVSQTQPWRPKSICVVLRFNVLLREPLILLSLSASSLQLVHFCLWQRESLLPLTWTLLGCNLWEQFTVDKAQNVFKGKVQIIGTSIQLSTISAAVQYMHVIILLWSLF